MQSPDSGLEDLNSGSGGVVMKLMRFPGFLALSFALIVLISLVACRGDSADTNTPPPFSAKLVKALDQSDLETRLKAELVKRYERMYDGSLYQGYAGGSGGIQPPPPSPVSPDSATPTAAGSNADITYSTTNVQEKGVDEGDLVKTDGTFIYMARGTHFFVLQATPSDQTALVSDTDLKEYISELHLSGSRVTVITYAAIAPKIASGVTSTVTPLICPNGTTVVSPPSISPPSGSGGTITVVSPNTSGAPVAAYPYSYQQGTRVYSYDVTNPAAPALLASFEFPGILEGSRRINNTIYLALNHSIDIPNPVGPWDYLVPGCFFDQSAYEEANKLALEENIRRINDLTLDDLLSTYTTTIYSGATATAVSNPTVSYADVYIPEFGNGTDLAIIVSIDLSNQVPVVASSSVLSSWGGIYMSQESLYLSSSNRWFWIEPMANAAMPQRNPVPQTAVHKFAIDPASGKPLYRGSGIVDGWVNDRFSMSDYQGNLRIGTTRGGWWGEGISNQLTILAEGSGSLVSTGTITGIAPGERIYSMRFDRDRGYMVTFHRTDPLFTFDLSDPSNPKLVGEIQVSGFATYIHLLGADRLLTIGQSADSTGRVNGNKLQLFDVSNLSAPALLAGYELGASWYNALYDPHAFLYYEPLGILTIPYFGSGVDANGIYTYTSGLKVFDIGPSSISQRGIISAPTVTNFFGSYSDTVDRSVVISSATGTSGSIFALAHRSVTVADAAQLDPPIKQVILPESYSYVYPMGGVVPPGMPAALAPTRK
jgi:uncharacterized secreted protein with C-terminal beta-propeller domain